MLTTAPRRLAGCVLASSAWVSSSTDWLTLTGLALHGELLLDSALLLDTGARRSVSTCADHSDVTNSSGTTGGAPCTCSRGGESPGRSCCPDRACRVGSTLRGIRSLRSLAGRRTRRGRTSADRSRATGLVGSVVRQKHPLCGFANSAKLQPSTAPPLVSMWHGCTSTFSPGRD
jgi:hypothetical protein